MELFFRLVSFVWMVAVAASNSEQHLRRRRASPSTKLVLCHIPPDDPLSFHDIIISEKAAGKHLVHGDLEGSCAAHCTTLCDDGDIRTIDTCKVDDLGCDHTCIDGYRMELGSCVDINECVEGTHGCPNGYSCSNIQGGFMCDDIDECVEGTHGCPNGFSCSNIQGGFECNDINECSEGTHNCDTGYSCINSEGSFYCQDVDECAEGTHNCGAGSLCTNTDGSFTCEQACTDVDAAWILMQSASGSSPGVQIRNGLPVLCYDNYSTKTSNLAFCSDVSCSSVSLQTIDSGSTSGFGWDTNFVLASSGFPVVSYHDKDNGAVKVTVCSDAYCAGTPTAQKVVETGGRRISMVVDESDHPVIAHNSASSTNLKLVVCQDIACSQFTSIDLDGSGAFPTLKYAGDKEVVMSYNSGGNSIKLARCNIDTLVCNKYTVPVTSSIGSGYVPLQINGNGNPVIAYTTANNAGVRVIVCADSLCSSVESDAAVHSTPAAYYFNQNCLSLDSNGNPVVAYYDDVAKRNQVSFCNDANCGSTSTSEIGIGYAWLNIAMDSHDTVYVAHTAPSGGGLQFSAFCAN